MTPRGTAYCGILGIGIALHLMCWRQRPVLWQERFREILDFSGDSLRLDLALLQEKGGFVLPQLSVRVASRAMTIPLLKGFHER